MFRSVPIYLQILVAALLGGLVGFVIGPAVAPIGQLGNLLLQLIKMLAGPLIFLAVLDAVLRTEMNWLHARRFGLLLVVNAAASLGIALLVANILRPGQWMTALGGATSGEGANLLDAQALSFEKIVKNLLPASVLEPLTTNSITGIVLVSLILGVAIRVVGQEREQAKPAQALSDYVHVFFKAAEKVLGWIIRWVPLAVFAVIAKTVGEKGLQPLLGLAAYTVAVIVALLLQVLVVYQLWLKWAGRQKLGDFWRKARDPVAYALGASSSLATLPVTLKTLDQEFKVGKVSSRMVACVGTNLNNDGILLYEALAVLIVAQAYGMELSLTQQLLAAGVCWIAAIGIGGIPDAGLISLSIVLTTVGLPLEMLPLLLAVDWILSRARATTNVISDLTGSIVLDRWDRRS
jgi:Na+/H+-dicarboxylate symporter